MKSTLSIFIWLYYCVKAYKSLFIYIFSEIYSHIIQLMMCCICVDIVREGGLKPANVSFLSACSEIQYNLKKDDSKIVRLDSKSIKSLLINWMKLKSILLLMEVSSNRTPSPGSSGIHVLQDSRKRLRGQVESWLGSWHPIFHFQFNLSFQRMLLTPSPGLSGIFISSMTPRRDLEDKWSLDLVPNVQSWWKFCWSFHRMPLPTWHHLQVYQEPSCPQRLQEET